MQMWLSTFQTVIRNIWNCFKVNLTAVHDQIYQTKILLKVSVAILAKTYAVLKPSGTGHLDDYCDASFVWTYSDIKFSDPKIFARSWCPASCVDFIGLSKQLLKKAVLDPRRIFSIFFFHRWVSRLQMKELGKLMTTQTTASITSTEYQSAHTFMKPTSVPMKQLGRQTNHNSLSRTQLLEAGKTNPQWRSGFM